MPQAKITVNTVIGSNTDLPINTAVQLDNVNIGGEVTYNWTILDQPPGTADTLSDATIQNPVFTPKKEGTYLIQLVVNQSLVDEQTDRVVTAVRQLKTGLRIPAAGETIQADPADGWAADTNAYLRAMDSLIAEPGIVVGANTSGGTLAPGTVLRVTSSQVIKAGLPGQEVVPGFTVSIATTQGNVDELLCLLEGPVTGSGSVGNGALCRARYVGRVSGITIGGSPSVGDTVFVSDSGTLSTTPGTVRRQVGSIMAISGGVADIWFDGVGGAELTPIDAPYVVYGVPGALINAKRVDGDNATPVVGGVPYAFIAGDISTTPIIARTFAGATAPIQEWQNEAGGAITQINPDGTLSTFVPSGGSNPAISAIGDAYLEVIQAIAGTGVAGAAAILGYIGDANGIGVVGSAASSANTDTARADFKNSGVLGVADSGAAALTAFAESGGYGLMVKGQGAPMSDLVAMLGAHPDAASFVAGGAGPGAYFFCNGAQPGLIVNNNGGPAIAANSLAPGDGAQFNNSGSGAGIHGTSLTGAGVWGSSLGASVGVLGTMSSGANVTAALAGFSNTGVLATADTGAAALAVYCTTGATAAVIKGSEASMTDVTTMLTNNAAAFYLTQKIVPAMYLESNATGGVLTVQNTGASGGGIFASINNGPGVAIQGHAVSGEGIVGTSLGGVGIKATGNATHAPFLMVGQAAPSSPGTGEIWFDTGENNVRYQDSAITQRIAKILNARFENIGLSSQTISNGSITAVTGVSVTVPANVVKAKDTILRCHFMLVMTRATAGTFALFLTLGGVPLPAVGLTSASSSGALCGYFDVVFDTVGASSEVVAYGVGIAEAVGATVSTSTVQGVSGPATNSSFAVGLSAQFGTANAGNAVNPKRFYVELL